MTSSLSFASGKQVWSINLQPKGYNCLTDVRIWFWRHYLVVDPDLEFCRVLNERNLQRASVFRHRGSTFFGDRRINKILVFDVDTHQEVPIAVLAGADPAAACPQVQGWWWISEPSNEVEAAWKDRLVLRDRHHGLYVNREGQPDSPLCSACADDLVRWVAPDLLLITKNYSEKNPSTQIVDLDGKTKYRIDPGVGANVVFNSTGTRFVQFGTYQTGWGHIRYWLDDQFSDFITTDRKTIRVFSTSSGELLFKKTWRKDEADADNNWQPDLKLALSDDGTFLAYYTHDARVLIYRLASSASH
ncbi:MAG TPA: hypothetical protein VFF39_01415 [Verrucomicrobiae bacterium]|nr:hypothetical protein [Verrucomicrobiae bacterium]